MCFIISNDLYMAHHNSVGICHKLKSFICMGLLISQPSVFVWGPVWFLWKGAPSTEENRICGSENSCLKLISHSLERRCDRLQDQGLLAVTPEKCATTPEYGDVCSFSCKLPGYEVHPSDASKIQCTSNGTWLKDPSLTTCKGK